MNTREANIVEMASTILYAKASAMRDNLPAEEVKDLEGVSLRAVVEGLQKREPQASLDEIAGSIALARQFIKAHEAANHDMMARDVAKTAQKLTALGRGLAAALDSLAGNTRSKGLQQLAKALLAFESSAIRIGPSGIDDATVAEQVAQYLPREAHS